MKNFKNLVKALQKVTLQKVTLQKVTLQKVISKGNWNESWYEYEISDEILNLLFEWYWHTCIITDLNGSENEVPFDAYWGEGSFEKLKDKLPEKERDEYTFEDVIDNAVGRHVLEREAIEQKLEREDLPESIEGIIKTYGLSESFQKSPMFKDLFPKTLPAKKYKESRPNRQRTFKGKY
jgi:hypothetical protein